jgi:hypothetical protein
MARLGRSRPVRPQISRGWIEFPAAVDTDAPAGLAAGTGDALQPEVTVAPNAGSPTAAGSALQATVVTGTLAPAGVASATGEALQPYTAHVGVAAGTGEALQPEATVAPKPGLGYFRATGGVVSTPDHASLAITDLDVTIRLAADDWTPAATQVLIGQTAFIGAIGWTLDIQTDGRLRVQWSTDGTIGTVVGHTTTNPLGFTDGTAHTIRVQLDVDAGGGNRAVTITTDGVLLEQFGGAATSIHNSNQALSISPAAVPFVGRVYLAQLLDGIGSTTAVANPNFDTPDSPTQVTDSTGKVWTVSGSGSIVTGVPTAAGSALQATVDTTTAAAPKPPVVATSAALAAAQKLRRQPNPTAIDVGAPLAQPETQAPAGVAEATGAALQATVQTSAEPARRPPVVVTPTAQTAFARRRQATAQFVDLGAPIVVEDTNALAGVASATGTANAATADIDAKPSAPTAAGTAPQPTVVTGTLANAGVASATGTANQPEAEIGAKPNTPTAAGSSDGQTVQTGTFTNAPAGIASATGSAFQPSIRITAGPGAAFATGTANAPQITVGARTGLAAATGTANQPTVAFGALALAGLASASGVANAPKIAIRVPAGVAAATGEAFGVFALIGNPLGDPQGIVAVDDDHSLRAVDGVGLIAVDDDHSL